MFHHVCQDAAEVITTNEHGQLLKNGKVMTEASIEERLRRFTTARKDGSRKCGDEVYNMWKERRGELTLRFKECKLNRARPSTHTPSLRH